MAEFLTIQAGSRAIAEFASAVLITETHPSLDQFIADDFCGVSYHAQVTSEEGEPMKINLRATFANLEEIMAAGGQEVLDKLYSGLVTSAGDGSVVLDVDTSGTLPCSKEELVGRLACLGRNLVGAPILLALDALKESNLAVTAPKKITISSSGQCMYVATKADRVAATYCLRFGDEADVALAKVVLQQMAETSGLNAHYSATCDIPGAPASNVGYLSLSVASMKATKSPDSCLTQLVYFPHYLDYHVKAAKAYVHSRLRGRVDQLVKVLNRARPEIVEATKAKSSSSRRHGSGAGAGAGAGAGTR